MIYSTIQLEKDELLDIWLNLGNGMEMEKENTSDLDQKPLVEKTILKRRLFLHFAMLTRTKIDK
jgi:hypothetical protein